MKGLSGSTSTVYSTAVQTPSDGGPSVTHTNNTGQYRDFHLIANLDTLQLSGFCNWRKAWNRAPG